MEWTDKHDGSYSLTVIKGDYDPLQHHWGEQHPESHLNFGCVSTVGDSVMLEYPRGQAVPLTEWLRTVDETQFLAVLHQLASVKATVASTGGKLHLKNVQTEVHMFSMDPVQGLQIIYTPLTPDVGDITNQQAELLLLESIKRLIVQYGPLQTELGQKLSDLINDPYLTLEMITALSYAAFVVPASTPAASLHTIGESFISATTNDREIKLQPLNIPQGVTNAIFSTLNQPLRPAPVEGNGHWRSAATEATEPLYSKVTADQYNNNVIHSPTVKLAYGTEEVTSDVATPSPATPVSSVLKQKPQLSYSSGLPTQDTPMQSTGHGAAPSSPTMQNPSAQPVQTPPSTMYYAPLPQSDQDKKHPKKAKTNRTKNNRTKSVRERKFTKEHKPAVAEETTEELSFEEQKQRCLTARITTAVVSLILLLFIIILFSFSNPFVAITFLLAIATAVLYLFKQGYASYLFMPKVVQKEPVQPKLVEVFNVRIKLQSVNLASIVEITIREREQILGSSTSQASKPTLNYTGISRRHCKISCITSAGNDTYYVEDLNSKYGTELNGNRLQPGQRYPLHFGDVLTLAHKYKFVVHSDAY